MEFVWAFSVSNKFLFLSLLVGLQNLAQAELLCHGLFLKASTTLQTDYRPRPETFHPSVLRQKVEAQEIRRFAGPEGSLELMRKHPHKNDESRFASIADHLLVYQLGFGFNDVAGVKGSIDFFKNQDKKTLVKALRGDWQSKITMYNLLRLVSGWINEAHPQNAPTDLTRKQDLLKILNPGDSYSLSARWVVLHSHYTAYMDKPKTSTLVALSSEKRMQNEVLTQILDLYDMKDLKFLKSPLGLAPWLGRHSTEEIRQLLETWIDKLHVSPEKSQLYKDKISLISRNPLVLHTGSSNALMLLHVTMIRYFNKYFYAERFPDLLTQSEHNITLYRELSKIQTHLQQFDSFYKRQEILLETALQNIEGFNRRLLDLEESIKETQQGAAQLALASTHPHWVQMLDSSLLRLQELKITDLSPELFEARFAELERIHFNFEKVTRDISRLKEQSEIHTFAELGLQWELLLPQKVYALAGYDYSSVIFSKEVIDFFHKNPERGSYFLAALSKGYVSMQNASGLRRLANIHPQMRDIKVLKHGGKVRIVGRLIGKTLHFFHIYDDDRPYDDPEIRRVIQRFTPPD